jgi:hypothetical protein
VLLNCKTDAEAKGREDTREVEIRTHTAGTSDAPVMTNDSHMEARPLMDE